MKKALITLLALASLAGCGGTPRKDGPAPVESALNRQGKAVATPAPPAPPVDVYAYRAPSSGPPPNTAPADQEGGPATLTAPPSEGPSARGTRSTAALPPDIDPGLAPAITWTPPAASTQSPAQRPAPSQVQAPASGAERSPSRTGAPPAAPAASSSPGATASPTNVALAAPPAAPKPPPPPPPVVRYTAPPPPAPALPAAAASLAAQAEKQRERGDYVAAAATLERAIRIQPREAYLWNRLARVRLDQNNYTQANSLAQKSNALSKDQDQIKQDNWGMIAATRRAAGDAKGAEVAEDKAAGK